MFSISSATAVVVYFFPSFPSPRLPPPTSNNCTTIISGPTLGELIISHDVHKVLPGIVVDASMNIYHILVNMKKYNILSCSHCSYIENKCF